MSTPTDTTRTITCTRCGHVSTGGTLYQATHARDQHEAEVHP